MVAQFWFQNDNCLPILFRLLLNHPGMVLGPSIVIRSWNPEEKIVKQIMWFNRLIDCNRYYFLSIIRNSDFREWNTHTPPHTHPQPYHSLFSDYLSVFITGGEGQTLPANKTQRHIREEHTWDGTNHEATASTGP